MTSREAAQFSALQRQVAQTLTRNFRQDRQVPAQRQLEYAGHVLTLQRHPLGGQVAGSFLRMIPPAERVAVQRAAEDLSQQEATRHQQDTAALQLHSLQRQLDELDQTAAQPVLERIQARRGAGQILPAAVRQHLEQGLNHDLGAVRIHDDAEADKLAKSIQALAFTTGTDIFFRRGQFDPNTQTGLELLAHEVTHTVQQSRGRVGAGIDPDAGLEHEARSMGQALASGAMRPAAGVRPGAAVAGTPRLSVRPAVQRKAAQASAGVSRPSVTIQTVTGDLDLLSRPSYVMTGQDRKAREQAAHRLDQAAQLKATDQGFWQQVQGVLEAKRGGDWLGVLKQSLPAPVLLRLEFALLGGTQRVTYAAFLNQLAMFSYSNDIQLSDSKGIVARAGHSVQQQAQSILDASGYEALPTVQGLWGFQMRVFRPRKGAKNPVSTKTVVTFRGTEGVLLGGINLPPLVKRVGSVTPSAESQKQNESFLDSMTDFAPYPTGYSQYEANEKQIINPVLKGLGSGLVAVGHSLGGALAQIAVTKNPTRFGEVYTFQGAKVQKADVERAMRQNKGIRANHFSVDGDIVPTSGQASVPGQFHKFNRAGGPVSPQSLDAVGGHNSPIMIEMLREFGQGGLLQGGGALAQALMQNGSHDPAANIDLSLNYNGARGHSDREAAKQNVLGSALQVGTFVQVIENNIVFNIYAERAVKLLQGKKYSSTSDLLSGLDYLYDQVIKQPLAYTPISRMQLEAVLRLTARMKTLKQLTQAGAKGQNMPPYGQSSPLLQADLQRSLIRLEQLQTLSEIEPAILSENRTRLRLRMLDLWYASNPDQALLYRQAAQRYLRVVGR